MSRAGNAAGEFRRPLGLVLSGGGALGAWQAGFLDVLLKAGLRFEKVLGFSAGALNGTGYFLNRMPELLRRWREIDKGRILRFRPRLNPLSIFDGASLWETVESAWDEEAARKNAVCEFIVVTHCVDDKKLEYSRFTPRGQDGWDGPLADRLVASSSIPAIFPPKSIGGKTYIDGGIPAEDWLRLDALADCRDVIVLEMIRPEQVGQTPWGPLAKYEQLGIDVVHKQVTRGIESLRALAVQPRIFRIPPSRVLDFNMLSFRTHYCAPAVEQGIADAKDFLLRPVETRL